MDQPLGIRAAIGPGGAGVSIRVKVVPGASRSRVVGMLGGRLKLAVAAPPEAGKANKTVCKLIAKVLDVPVRDIVVASGASHPIKTLSVAGLTVSQTIERLSSVLPH